MRNSFLFRISNSKTVFLYCSLFLLLLFLFTRLQYFLNYPIIVLSSDSASYCAVAFDIMNSKVPSFDIRTPGYPLFLSSIWVFSKSILAAGAAQSIFTILCSIFFLWSISKTYRSLTILFTLAIAIFITSSYYLVLEVSILTEGLFVSFMLVNSGLLILALKKNQILIWILYSASVAVLILIRPAGLFLFGIIVLIIFFFIVNKYKVKFFAALILPSLLIILSLCLYNYITLKKFTITPFGEANLAGVTILFMEPSDEYPGYVNEAIQITLDSIPRTEVNYVKNSLGIPTLYHTFNGNFYRQVNLTEAMMKLNPGLTFLDVQPITRKISIDAIKKNPKLYAKFVVTNFIYFFANVRIVMDYYQQLENIYKRTVIEKKYITELESGRWRQVASDNLNHRAIIDFFSGEIEKQQFLESVEIGNDDVVKLKSTFWKSLFVVYEAVYNFMFRNILWIILYGVVFFISLYQLFKSKFREVDSFIPFLFCMTFLAKAILVSTVEVSLTRYTYTVEFVIYFSLPFLFILLKKPKQIKSKTNDSVLTSVH